MKKSHMQILGVLIVLLAGGFLLSTLSGSPEKPKTPAAVQEAGQQPAAASKPDAAKAKTADPAGKKAGDKAGAGQAQALEDDFEMVASLNIRDREVLRTAKPIIVTFASPMVAQDQLEKPVAPEEMPFMLKPSVEGEGRWLTPTSFAFVAEKGFSRGKQYALALRKDLRSLEGKSVRYYFSFRTEATKLRELQLGSYDEDTFEQRIYLDFTLPVSREALSEHMAVLDAETEEALPVDFSGNDTVSSSHTATIRLGQYRPKVLLVLRTDRDSDQHPMAMDSEYKSNIILAATKASSNANAQTDAAQVSTVQANSVQSEPSDLRMYAYSNEDYQGRLYARFSMNRSLAPHDQTEFIKVTPDLEYSLEGGSEIMFRQGLEPGMNITVTLLPGLTDSAGRAVKEEITRSVVIDDYEAAARFAEHGNILTPIFGSRVPVTLMNLDRVSITLHRQYENNLPFMSLQPEYFATRMMRQVEYKTIDLPAGQEKNKSLRRAIDLNDLAKGKRGVFSLSITGYQRETDSDGSSYYSYANSQDRLVVLTDIAVTSRLFPTGITIYATSLSTAKPLPGAQVKIYSQSNQLLGSGLTGPDGVFMLKRSESWDDQLWPNVVTVQTGAGDDLDITFLALQSEHRMDLPDTAWRDYLDRGYEAFMYTPRGVFRPGEKVDIKAFVRDADHAPPAPFPVFFRITSSRGLEVARGSVTLSDEGGADYAFNLPSAAPTGKYHAYLEIPGQQDKQIGYCSFDVEDFVPPRLEVSVSTESEFLVQQKAMEVGLSGQYLFGAPGAELSFELGYKATPESFQPEGWEDYSFGNWEKKFNTETNLKYITGELDAQGKQKVSFPIPDNWTPPATLRVLLVGAVQEDGGRWVNQTASFIYCPTPYLIGLSDKGRSFEPGKEAVIAVAAVTPDGKNADSGELAVEISTVRSNWRTVYRNNRYVSVWEERILPLHKQKIDTVDGKGEIRFTPREQGTFLVRVSADNGAVVSSGRFDVWHDYYGDGERPMQHGSGRMDAVELSFDKKDYRVGDTARLSVKAPYAGTLFLGVERASQMYVRTVNMLEPAIVVEIPVTEGMDPNVNVTAWVIRPVREENKEWYAHRAYGMIPLLLAKEPHALTVSAVALERASPSQPLAIPFSVVDEHGTPVEGEFSVALIDEGILSLTGYKTPDPLSFFMAQRMARGSSFDAFDALLRPEARTTPLLQPGGDGMDDYQGSLSTEQIFLTAYLPVVRTDANGQGEAFFDIPEYSGKGRLMVVGASHNRFASMGTQIRFARDIVVESTAPRAVAPGDEFDISLKLFTLQDASAPLEGEAHITVTSDAPLLLSGDVKSVVPLGTKDDGADKTTRNLLVKAKARQLSGVATINIAVTVPGREDLSFDKSMQVVVRPPYPRTSAMVSALIKGGSEKELVIPGKWLAGSEKASFSIDKSPLMAVLPALEYLREYPYGCLEQTVARAWPYLTLDAVQKALNPDRGQDDTPEGALAGAASRIIAMQTPEGGFGIWPGYSTPAPWRSVNAAFFLVEAKSRVSIPKSSLDRMYNYLRLILAAPVEQLGDNKRYVYSTKAFAAFVLTRAGQAPLGWLQHLTEQEKEMYPSGRLFLAGAKSLIAGNPDALRALKPEELRTDGLREFNYSLESSLRNASLELYMWALVAPGDARTSELCENIADMLLAHRWYTTQEAGMASLALGTWLEKTGGPSGRKYEASVIVDGKVVAKAKNGERLVLGSDAVPLTANGEAAKVRVAVSGEGSAYCIYNMRGVPFESPPASAREMAIQRVWKDANGAPIDMSSGEIRLKKGDRITVELTVVTRYPMSDIVLSDLLPGGMEVENPRLNTAAGATDGETQKYGLYMDLREDRLLIFFDALNNKGSYSYSMRAVSKGRFVLPPLAADGMYAPQVNAITPAA
ncbi:hypothetical protein LJC59_02840, partial [Desulfovibrio sp. OttesenSCG-928-A18]|nr:hypothetical protein [Desulfovibrio sp. OttesenSCG-928-A18]